LSFIAPLLEKFVRVHRHSTESTLTSSFDQADLHRRAYAYVGLLGVSQARFPDESGALVKPDGPWVNLKTLLLVNYYEKFI